MSYPRIGAVLPVLVERGVEYFTAYLLERLAEGEMLAPDSPAIAAFRTMSIKNKFMAETLLREKGEGMSRKAISAPMRRAIRPSNTSVSRFRPSYASSDGGLIVTQK
jgi:hypothetical protein